MIITEKQLLEVLDNADFVQLVEPPCKQKYPPLGLGKIQTYLKQRGIPSEFTRNYKPQGEDVICITSLFTYGIAEVKAEIEKVLTWNPGATIILGGIAASLITRDIEKVYGDRLLIFKGYSKVLDQCPVDFNFDWKVRELRWNDYSFVFTTRGCPNRCPYCAVWRIEPETWINEEWKKQVDLSKPNIMISDNNLSAQPIEHIQDVLGFCIEHKLKVILDNGFDCKHVTEEMAPLLAKVRWHQNGLRLAFDRIEEDGTFQNAVQTLLDGGVPKTSMMAYVLFNFHDNFAGAYYRAKECLRLGVRPYPMQYTPLDWDGDKKNKFIGKHWTKNLALNFRYFYIMGGLYNRHNFMQWIHGKLPDLPPALQVKGKLTEEELKLLEETEML
jgi:hypothetical protein